MDLKVNSLNFQGKKEILYGLNKAADAIHSYSVYTQPRLIQHGENKIIDKYEASAKAYLDMITKDKSFAENVAEFNNKNLKEIRNHLKAYDIGIHKENPMKYFREFIESVMQNNHTNTQKGKNALAVLLKKLEA